MSYQNVPGYFNFEILYSDIIRCAPPSSMLVEVGVWYGKSITFLAEQARIANKNLQLFAVDTWRGSTDQQGEDHDALEASYGGVWRVAFFFELYSHRKGKRFNHSNVPAIRGSRKIF